MPKESAFNWLTIKDLSALSLLGFLVQESYLPFCMEIGVPMSPNHSSYSKTQLKWRFLVWLNLECIGEGTAVQPRRWSANVALHKFASTPGSYNPAPGILHKICGVGSSAWLGTLQILYQITWLLWVHQCIVQRPT
jgi:hypothetical protein